MQLNESESNTAKEKRGRLRPVRRNLWIQLIIILKLSGSPPGCYTYSSYSNLSRHGQIKA